MGAKSVLILGAGLMQKPAILAAKSLKIKTYVIDADKNAVCVPLADHFENIDLKDKEQIYNYAKGIKAAENLVGIFTAGTDFSTSVSYCAEKLQLPCHSYESALNASIKTRMRKCFASQNVPSPDFYSFSGSEITQARVLYATESLGYPCVIKPVDNMGARGCRMIRSWTESYSAACIAAENSRTKTIIIEKYMDGPEFSIDALVYKNSITITGFADRHIFYPPYFIETGHTMPSKVLASIKKELIATFALGIKSLGLSCGAAKADIKYTEKGPQIGEIAARLSGGYMSGWTYPYASECNLTEQALLIACNEEPSWLLEHRIPLNIEESPFSVFEIPCKNVSAERCWLSIPGKVKEVEGFENAKKVPFVKDVLERNVKAGDVVDFPRNNVQKCGNIISLAQSFEKAENSAQKAVSNILIRLEPNNSNTEDFINAKQNPNEKGFPPAAFELFYDLKKYNLSGFIEKNSPVLESVSKDFVDVLKSSKKDWSYMTAYEVASRFDLLMPEHPAMEKNRFWSALLKGGLQAAIYVSDSYAENELGEK